jgi:DMSO/TMAO reductase YedYZ molybdopterin-dependent catalytic subunit
LTEPNFPNAMTSKKLPPGQRPIATFPRFGLLPFATRFPDPALGVQIGIGGDVAASVTISNDIAKLARVEQTSDFHCVTTWTSVGLRWGGHRFTDFYHQIVVPQAGPLPGATFVVLRGRDGARTSLPLEDLLQDDVLLADQLDGVPLSVAHGGPLRIVAPSHYGYKSVKFISRIEFWRSDERYTPYGLRFMVNPRARVALEERGQWVPGWLLRYLYRPLIGPTMRYFQRMLARHQD